MFPKLHVLSLSNIYYHDMQCPSLGCRSWSRLCARVVVQRCTRWGRWWCSWASSLEWWQPLCTYSISWWSSNLLLCSQTLVSFNCPSAYFSYCSFGLWCTRIDYVDRIVITWSCDLHVTCLLQGSLLMSSIWPSFMLSS